jgi:hypothetical protein
VSQKGGGNGGGGGWAVEESFEEDFGGTPDEAVDG